MHDGKRVQLRVGKTCSQLAALMAEGGFTEAFCITAWNPYSEETSLVRNQANQQRLLQLLTDAGASVLPASGEAADASWDPEPGFLVLGLPREKAIALGREFHQNAVLAVSADGLVNLLLLR